MRFARPGFWGNRLAVVSMRGAMVAAVCMVLNAGAAPVRAAELSAEACRELLRRKQGLDALGIGEIVARGPDWARQNASAADIVRVRDYIGLEEQILFRCTPGFQNAVVMAIKQPNRARRVAPPLPMAIAAVGLRPKRVPPRDAAPVGAQRDGVPLPQRNRWVRRPVSRSQPRVPIQPSPRPAGPAPLPERKTRAQLPPAVGPGSAPPSASAPRDVAGQDVAGGPSDGNIASWRAQAFETE